MSLGINLMRTLVNFFAAAFSSGDLTFAMQDFVYFVGLVATLGGFCIFCWFGGLVATLLVPSYHIILNIQK